VSTRHCVACGAPLAPGRPATCAACGTVDWGNAKPCAAALVVHDGKLLLVRRAHDPWRGAWCAPSGFCDGPEHPVAAAEREAREEAGVDVRVTGYLGTWIDPYDDDPAATGVDVVSVAYFHATLLGEPDAVRVDEAEASEVGWFEPDALPSPLAPVGSGRAIYAAWRAAVEAGELVTPLRDRR
jgi:ADP-ribose pyrophosphatase YjhB (NUDIX family)